MTGLLSPSTAEFRPLLKWPGGKRREWDEIAPHLPGAVRHFIDPFMGGLAPFAGTSFTGDAWLNDRHERLVALHRFVQAQDEAFLAALGMLAEALSLGDGPHQVGTSPADAARDFRDVPRARPTVVIVGCERRGMSRAQRRACDFMVSIPMAPGSDSLNVGVAAGIALFAVLHPGPRRGPGREPEGRPGVVPERRATRDPGVRPLVPRRR